MEKKKNDAFNSLISTLPKQYAAKTILNDNSKTNKNSLKSYKINLKYLILDSVHAKKFFFFPFFLKMI